MSSRHAQNGGIQKLSGIRHAGTRQFQKKVLKGRKRAKAAAASRRRNRK